MANIMVTMPGRGKETGNLVHALVLASYLYVLFAILIDAHYKK